MQICCGDAVLNVVFCFRVVEMDGKRGHVSLKNPQKPGEPPKEFTFDAIYDWK